MKKIYTIPLIPLRGMTVFPKIVVYFDVGRRKSVEAVEKAMLDNREIFLAQQKDAGVEEAGENDIFEIGTICKIKQVLKLSENTVRVLVEGIERAKIVEYIDDKSYVQAKVEKIRTPRSSKVELEAYQGLIDKELKKLFKLSDKAILDIFEDIDAIESPSEYLDNIAEYLITDFEIRQQVLETVNIIERAKIVLSRLKKEIAIAKIQMEIGDKVKNKLTKEQKDYYLREQIKVIQEELGEDDGDNDEISVYEQKIAKAKISKETKDKLTREVERLKNMGLYSAESNTIMTYLDWALDVPWGKYSKETLDVVKARKVLNEEHYGLEDVKDRIIEYLAVKQVSKSQKGPILCLVGPPGVGKTSIARSIAHAMNRKYTRISLGGMKDESEIRGHRKTYVGAIPGRIVYALKDAKTMNPLILFDEIDKISANYKGDPSDALLEILDSEQNKDFRDAYLELPLNLSKVMFIATANSLDTIPRPLLDRMEVIEVSGYTYEEKFHIAKEHLIPKIFKELDIEGKNVIIEDDAVKKTVEGYTRESGVRDLERKLTSLIRKAVAQMLESGEETYSVNAENVEKLLGKQIFDIDEIDKYDKIGVVNGMAWTAYGGDTLPIEAAAMSGNGKLELTGKLGEVMQESAKTAYSYVRANAKKFGIDETFYKKKDIHIHAPEGAIPKDGPSAGVTMVTALVSALSGRKVRHNVAMTGEVTLTGRVLPIGGLKEKSLAAFRAGVDTIIIPKENEKDIEKIPDSIRTNLNIIPASEVNEVLKNALVGEEINEN